MKVKKRIESISPTRGLSRNFVRRLHHRTGTGLFTRHTRKEGALRCAPKADRAGVVYAVHLRVCLLYFWYVISLLYRVCIIWLYGMWKNMYVNYIICVLGMRDRTNKWYHIKVVFSYGLTARNDKRGHND